MFFNRRRHFNLYRYECTKTQLAKLHFFSCAIFQLLVFFVCLLLLVHTMNRKTCNVSISIRSSIWMCLDMTMYAKWNMNTNAFLSFSIRNFLVAPVKCHHYFDRILIEYKHQQCCLKIALNNSWDTVIEIQSSYFIQLTKKTKHIFVFVLMSVSYNNHSDTTLYFIQNIDSKLYILQYYVCVLQLYCDYVMIAERAVLKIGLIIKRSHSSIILC